MISLSVNDAYIEHIIWFLVFAIGGAIGGGFVGSILFNGRIARTLFGKLVMLGSIGYWLVYFTGYVEPRTVLYYWDRFGAGMFDELLHTIRNVIG